MKKVMATGTFDLLHPGHGIYLNEAKKLGGEDAKLYVVIARDSTVEKRKRGYTMKQTTFCLIMAIFWTVVCAAAAWVVISIGAVNTWSILILALAVA